MKLKEHRLAFTLIIIAALIAALIAAVFLFWLLHSPGKLPVLTDGDGKPLAGAINEKGSTLIGGVRQGYFLRGENPANPVLLYLHGGPGSPELPFLMAAEKAERLEKYFTVCYWDQRGAGMTYSSSCMPEEMTLERMVEDTKEITEYLLKRFGVGKIYLIGHSWGSYLGVKTAEKYPQLYAAYIGIGQVSHQQESERLAYDYMLSYAKETGDSKAIASLEKFDRNAPDFPEYAYLLGARMKYMNKYGIGIAHDGASMASVARDVLLFKGYTIADKLNYLRGMQFSLNTVWDYVASDNLFDSSPSLEVPVYVMQGKYDYQVSQVLAEKYVESLRAPRKRFFLFENSAHSPNMEESETFVQNLRLILDETSSR